MSEREVLGIVLESLEELKLRVQEAREKQRSLEEAVSVLVDAVKALKVAVEDLKRRVSALEERLERLESAPEASIGEDGEFFRAFTPGGGDSESRDSEVYGRVLERGSAEAGRRPLEKGGDL